MGFATLVFACATCGARAQANPLLVMSIPARWDGAQYVADPPVLANRFCEACARQLKARFEREGLPFPAVVRQSDYFARAYHEAAEEHDV